MDRAVATCTGIVRQAGYERFSYFNRGPEHVDKLLIRPLRLGVPEVKRHCSPYCLGDINIIRAKVCSTNDKSRWSFPPAGPDIVWKSETSTESKFDVDAGAEALVLGMTLKLSFVPCGLQSTQGAR